MNRLCTPWLDDNLHRAIYSSEKYPADNQNGQHIRQELEPLFHDYQVDIVIAGH